MSEHGRTHHGSGRVARTAESEGARDPVASRLASSRSRKGQARDMVQALGRLGGGDVQRTAAEGVSGSGGPLPHLDAVQASFGRHDVGGVRAHVGGRAADASAAIGARAYATGNDVAFAHSPDLHTAAHEAAHVVQQRAGVQLAGGVGEEGDAYERHADAVADAVVQGRSAEGLLDASPGGGAGVQRAVQRDGDVAAQRNAAKLAMEEWKSEQLQLLNRQKDFEDQNWTWYLSRTSLNPFLTMDEAWYIGLAAGALTAVLGALVPTTAIGTKIGSLVGTAAGPAGTVVGAVVGFVLGAIAGLIIGLLTDSPDSAAAAAAQATGDQIGEQIRASSARRDDQFATVESEIETQKGVVDAETDTAVLDQTAVNFQAEKRTAARAKDAIDTSSRTMAREMLQRWTLQHAGDEEDQASDTSETQWDTAADATGLRTDGNIRRPDLFIHQSEAVLTRAGLDPRFFGESIARMKETVGGSSGDGQQNVDVGGRFRLTASQALDRYQKRYIWPTGAIADARRFEDWYLASYRADTGQSWVSRRERRDIRRNRVHVECFLDLTTADGACYVNEWEWRLVFPSVEELGWMYDGDHSFDISPD